jgi:hypothetical protein
MKIYGRIDPQSIQNRSKRAVGAVGVDLLIIFIDFGTCRKIDLFLYVLGASKKGYNSSPGAPRGRQVRRSGDFWDRGPRGASCAELLNNTITGEWYIF